MHTTVISPKNGCEDLRVTWRLNLLVVCEDSAAAGHVQRVYRNLREQLGDDFEFEPQWWDFDALAESHLRAAAALDAAKADLIILSCHAREELPAHVKAWFQLWLGRNVNPPALAVSLTPAAQGSEYAASLVEYLRELARHARMDFFSDPGLEPAHPSYMDWEWASNEPPHAVPVHAS